MRPVLVIPFRLLSRTQYHLVLPLLFLLSPYFTDAGLLDSIFGGGGGSSNSGANDEQQHSAAVSDDKAMEYLQNFGYVAPGQLNFRGLGTGDFSDPVKSAVRKFQEFAHLPVTGKLDVKTKKKMAQPRCGMQDAEMLSTDGLSPHWRKSMVTYRITNFSPDLASTRQREAIRRAYQTWASVIPLQFQETQGQADINVLFAARSHGDPWPFDGKGGVLAHATMPTDGKLHFDEDENWVLGPEDASKIATSRYTDLYPVAIHEIGHTLGLSHSKVEDAIMAPFYQESVDSQGNYVMPRLKSDDIRAIQAIYGSGKGSATGSSSATGGGGFSPGRGSTTTTTGGGGRGTGSKTSGGFGSGGRTSSFGGFDWGGTGSGRRGSSSSSGFGDWGSSGFGGSSSSGSGRRTSTSDFDWPSSTHGGFGSSSMFGGGRSSSSSSTLDRLFDKWLGRRRR